jgi:hypothetical protein
MGDTFKEQLVKKKPNTSDTLKRAGVIAAVLVLALVCIMIPAIAAFTPIIIAAAAVGAYFLFSLINVEYEYAFVNGELDIDIIYSKSRRKRIFSAEVRNIEVMAHVEDTAHTRDFGNAEVKNYYSGVAGKDTYAFLINYKGKRLKVLIEPNETMLKAFSKVLTPRKLFKKL